MDKRVIFATAGSGKTTYIVNSLSSQKRSLIVTYTNANYANLQRKIRSKFDGSWPENITLLTYFSFLFNFCYKPFLSDKIGAKGLCFQMNKNMYSKQDSLEYFLSISLYLYGNRLSLLLERAVLIEIKNRMEKYFDEFVIDEIQDFAGRDFNFLENLSSSNINILFVGDFHQHTFDTSRDGTVNKSLFDNKEKYEERFAKNGFIIDKTTLRNNWRCSKSVCDFIRDRIPIDIFSNRAESDNTNILLITDADYSNRINNDHQIIKLHFQKSSEFGICHKNWGDTKGEDHYTDVCIFLNKKTASFIRKISCLNYH